MSCRWLSIGERERLEDPESSFPNAGTFRGAEDGDLRDPDPQRGFCREGEGKPEPGWNEKVAGEKFGNVEVEAKRFGKAEADPSVSSNGSVVPKKSRNISNGSNAVEPGNRAENGLAEEEEGLGDLLSKEKDPAARSRRSLVSAS